MYAHSRRTLAIASLATLATFLDTTVLFVAFPAIRATFARVSAAQLSWVLNAYTIVFGALLVPSGRIADRVGRKRTFLLGLALFSAASALCGLAPSAGALIAARALQAVGAALLLPSSLAVVLHAFVVARRAGPRAGDLGGRNTVRSCRWFGCAALCVGAVHGRAARAAARACER